jgi:hypothetical protein
VCSAVALIVTRKNCLNLAADLNAIGQRHESSHTGPAFHLGRNRWRSPSSSHRYRGLVRIVVDLRWQRMVLLSIACWRISPSLSTSAGPISGRGLIGIRSNSHPHLQQVGRRRAQEPRLPYMFFWQSAQRIRRLVLKRNACRDKLPRPRTPPDEADRRLRNGR